MSNKEYSGELFACSRYPRQDTAACKAIGAVVLGKQGEPFPPGDDIGNRIEAEHAEALADYLTKMYPKSSWAMVKHDFDSMPHLIAGDAIIIAAHAYIAGAMGYYRKGYALEINAKQGAKK
tara:strand:- start:1339 stop:1701 length:363 start_codon:yes stop_codon:yes gene_type:complete